MNTSKAADEQISLFADGELHPAEHVRLLSLLREPQARASWDTYHHIGDAMRSSDTAMLLSPDFEGRMAARLAAEPAYLGADRAPLPESLTQAAQEAAAQGTTRRLRRFAIPGAAVAAAVVLSVAVGHKPGGAGLVRFGQSADSVAAVVAPITVLRDPQIDEYLLAHQRFSPSVYSTAQFARSATFATESAK